MKLQVCYLGVDDRPRIGELFEAPTGAIHFQYDRAWRDRGLELSPIYLPLSQELSIATPTPGFGPLFGLFDDSLPDWWGQQLLKRFFDELGIPWNRVGALQKLSAQGVHGIGALGYEPDLGGGDFRSEISLEVARLVADARKTFHGEAGEVLPQFVRSGISAGGAQPKALVHFSADFSTLYPGGAGAPEGTSAWLIKFQLDRDVLTTREEHAYALMAAAAGVDVPETRLLEDAEGQIHFLSRRFDRDGSTPRHVHTYSGLTHTLPRDGLDYGTLMDLARSLCGSETAVEEVFRRAVFNVAAGNDDDHGRNHAFMMEAGGDWSPTPAYDLTFASHPLATNLRSASVNGRFSRLSRADLVALGKSQAVRRIDDQIDKVLAAIRRWPEFAAAAGLPEAHAAQLHSEMPGSAWGLTRQRSI